MPEDRKKTEEYCLTTVNLENRHIVNWSCIVLLVIIMSVWMWCCTTDICIKLR